MLGGLSLSSAMSETGHDFDTQGSLTLMCFRGKMVLSNRLWTLQPVLGARGVGYEACRDLVLGESLKRVVPETGRCLGGCCSSKKQRRHS